VHGSHFDVKSNKTAPIIKKLLIGMLFCANILIADTVSGKTILEFADANTTCPVRFIDIKKYPSYAALIVYEDGTKEFFSSPKYMFRYYFDNPKSISGAFVADFVTAKFIDVKNGYFVFGSNLMSIGGDDLIAFDSEEKAKMFSEKHNGKKIFPFDNISKKLIEYLDMK